MNQTSQVEKISIINRYLTPLAIILILLAVIFAKPIGWSLFGSLILIGISLINNIIIPLLIKKPAFGRKFRMVLNILVNILLLYLLGKYWPPVWYLFLFTPVATAVYSTRLNTYLVSLAISLLLILIYAAQGISSPQHWGHIFSRVLLIIFLSLLINTLAASNKKT